MEKTERLEYLDTLKLLAISYIFVAHFAATDNQNKVSLFISALHTLGITGKLCVGVLAVIMGFLAYIGKETNLIKYSVKRYLQFFFCGLFINVLFFVFFANKWLDSDGTMTFVRMLKNSLLLGWDFNPNYWCMQAFLVASIICKANHIYEVPVSVMILEIVLLLPAWNDFGIWTAVGLLGSIVGYYYRNEERWFHLILSKRWMISFCWIINLLLLGIIYVFRENGQITYCLYGLMGMFIFVELLSDQRLRQIYSLRFWDYMGRKNYMGIFLLHGFLLDTLLPFILAKLGMIQYSVRYALALLLLYFFMVLCSVPLMYLVKKCTNLGTQSITQLMIRVKNK